jgi:hypothetical protein
LNFRTELGGDDITSSFSFSEDAWVELNVLGAPAGGGRWDVSAQTREYTGTTPGAWNAITLSGSNWNPATPFQANWVTLNQIRNDAGTAVDDISLVVPEPGTLALLCLGLGIFARRVRRGR